MAVPLEHLTRTIWRFSRTDGVLLCDSLRLLRDGGIGGYDNPNERGWRIADGTLELLGEGGRVTARLDGDPTGASFVAPHVRLDSLGPAWARGRPLAVPPRVCVLIRTHVVNAKLWHLFDCLDGSPAYDLFILGDETNGPLDVGRAAYLPHTLAGCAALGLPVERGSFNSVLWPCGDYPLYCARAARPGYDYYVQIEYDVHLTRLSPYFLEALINRLMTASGALDFVSTVLVPAHVDSGFGLTARRLFDTVLYGGIFSLVVASARALDHLRDERRREGATLPQGGDPIHCEMFAVTALAAAGFRLAGLRELCPQCLGATYHPGRPDMFEPNYLLGTHDPDPRIELVHPVLDAEEYLARLLRHHSAIGDLDGFRRHLDGLDPRLVSEATRQRFREAAQ